MKARFEVRTIKAQWKPPFNKDITEEVFEVSEGENFDRIVGNGNDEQVYTLLTLNGNGATVHYSKLFTLKTGNPGNYQITLIKDAPIEMTYLWGEDGMTKKITFKGIAVEEEKEVFETKEIAQEIEDVSQEAMDVCEQTNKEPEKC
jgi:hypothetical protein